MRRNTRNYKDKKPMLTFGQFVLPLTVIMAVALLFFSVKLFFLSPEAVRTEDEPPKREAVKSPDAKPATPDIKIEDIKEPQPEKTKAPAARSPEPEKQTDTKPAKVETKTKTTTKPTTKSEEPKKPQTEPTPQTKAANTRWDVQVGGFVSLDSAKALLKKATKEGYASYIEEGVRNGAPFYKVRVNGAPSKLDAGKIAAKLEAAGYPVYLVEIKK